MPRAFSLALRTRIVSACEQPDLTQAEIADLFQVHVKTVEKYRHLWRTGQDLTPQRHTAGPPRALAGHEDDLRALVAAQPDATLATWAAALAAQHQVTISVSALCRSLQRLQITRKKRR